MTREEFIKHIDDGIMCGINNIEREYLENLYDEITKPQWISVEDYSKDELPPLIDKNNPYGESVQVLFVVVLDGVQFINKGTFDYDTGVWHSLEMQCSFCKENVTHWISLPSVEHLKKGGKK
jgi:hypothetical protein